MIRRTRVTLYVIIMLIATAVTVRMVEAKQEAPVRQIPVTAVPTPAPAGVDAVSIVLAATQTEPVPASPPPDCPDITSIDVNINRAVQLLTVNCADGTNRTMRVSSGTEVRYCAWGRDGRRHCGSAITDVGSFQVCRRVEGIVRAPLGNLYNPNYIDCGRGIAIHGSHVVPDNPTPLSHGCIRVSIANARWLIGRTWVGLPINVHK